MAAEQMQRVPSPPPQSIEVPKKNIIQVSNNKKPLFFYVNLAKRNGSVNSLISTLFSGMEERSDMGADQVFVEMPNSNVSSCLVHCEVGCPPNVSSYNTMVSALWNCGDRVWALQMAEAKLNEIVDGESHEGFWKIGAPKLGELGYSYLAPLIGLLKSQTEFPQLRLRGSIKGENVIQLVI
ncbi:hypothetical protein ACFX1Q_001505 [Malus domestica]